MTSLRSKTLPIAQTTVKRALSITSRLSKTHSIPASFYRGGTSKAVVFNKRDLPDDTTQHDRIFLSAIGSPDPNGRQLNGMGGGLSSVSKVLVVSASERSDADVNYTFAQVAVKSPVVDYGSNCGNMLAAVGPFALENGLVKPRIQDGKAVVRVYNTNTKKVINSTFPVAAEDTTQPDLCGDFAIDGVAGTSARITLDFINPGGSRTGKLLPTGHVVEQLTPLAPNGTEYQPVRATLMDCGNPCVFVLASDINLDPTILPPQLERDSESLALLEAIRLAAALRMGLVKTLEDASRIKSVPKVLIMSPRSTHKVLSGDVLNAESADLVTRCISSGDPHRAIPITAALCVVAASQLEGTIAHEVMNHGDRTDPEGTVIAHASGTITVGAEVEKDAQGGWFTPKARVFRTARKLFEGRIFWDD
ncbi:hypothetical protein I316_06826 [Kwoniella heveanensis BCC8398]|uniref:Methylitaconate delta2-delta3-isomerase n=1 Tax=Kwoniella heveanensis BCC8398 TaxID=1296120 RepID=A0A1B9GK39_9TREE|nr:hypothetical protein I316_06826 [Kwoniella heveanensis BCC8398]